MKTIISVGALLLSFYNLFAQFNFPSDPAKAEIVDSDIDLFWKDFDRIGKSAEKNPFEEYILKGSKGVAGFTPYRIISADSLYQKVLSRKKDYEAIRESSYLLSDKEKQIKAAFYAFKYWYPKAVFPPTYFVVGRFNSGGTLSEDGLIIGAEMQQDVNNVPFIVAHELIHFQQTHIETPTLLHQCIIEGSADFLGELISGNHSNPEAFAYGEENAASLISEFRDVMDTYEYVDWLYGTSGKDNRPNDLGYWIGYKITEAFFNKAEDKHKAIDEIINFKNAHDFLNKSGFLEHMRVNRE